MGGLFGGKTTTKTKSTENVDMGPSKFQLPYLQETFGEAKNIYEEAKGTPYYQGDTYAGLSPEQRASADAMKSYAGDTAIGDAGAVSGYGRDLLGDTYGKAATNLDRFTSMAGEDATGANMAAGSRYADNPYMDQMIDGASRDVQRNLYENQIPGIDRAASHTGNINSSRAGIAAGIAHRGAADRIADISAGLRGSAYESGLDRAQLDRSSTMDAYARAADGYSGLSDRGISAIGSGQDMAYDAYGRQMDVDRMGQVDQQSELDAAFARWQGEDTRKMDLLARYGSVTNGSQWGQSGTVQTDGKTTQKNSGNILGQLAGAAASAASIYTGMKSDRRLKFDIVRLGELADGLPIYRYRYVQDSIFDLPSEPQIGFMADEVAEFRPHALGPVDRGYATVNYDLI